MNNKLFNFPGGDLSKSEFNEAMDGLIDKGLAKKVIIDNVEYFQLTSMGECVGEHLNSNQSTKN